ncbi:MAG: FecR family protein [Xanthobacteraceae bacterium]
MENSDSAYSPKKLNRRVLIGFAGAAFFGQMSLSQAQPAERAGTVTELKGDAFAELQNQRRALEQSAALFIKDTVGTGSDARLTMRLGKDTTLHLGQLARLTIDRFLVNAGGDITLDAGPMLFDSPAGRLVPLQVHSSFGLIAVRGTRFFAGPSNGVFGVFVERGRVAVTAAGVQVVVGEGQGTNIARPGDAPTTPAPWGAPRINAAMQSVQ